MLEKSLAPRVVPFMFLEMSGPEGTVSFVLLSSDVSRDEVEGNIRTRGKTKLTGFPRDLILSVLLYF